MSYPNQESLALKATAAGTAYEEIIAYPDGQTKRAVIHHPTSVSTTAPAVLVMHCHGVGLGTTEDGTRMQTTGTRDAFINKGWLVASMVTGASWGNAVQRANYLRMYNYMKAIWNVQHVLLIGESMGGLVVTDLFIEAAIPNIRGLGGISPAVNLAAAYAKNSLDNDIRTAYGIAGDGSDYALRTATSGPLSGNANPVLRPSSDYTNGRFRYYSSYADSTAPKGSHADVLAGVVGTAPFEFTSIECIGGHLSTDQFRPDDIVAFYDRALHGDPSYEDPDPDPTPGTDPTPDTVTNLQAWDDTGQRWRWAYLEQWNGDEWEPVELEKIDA